VRFDVITLFPELFAPLLSAGVTRRAFESGQVEVRLWNPRDFAEGNYRRVDDRPFGGGPGMVMLAEPLERCLQAIGQDRKAQPCPVVLFSPIGERLTHASVQSWSNSEGAVLLCGRYEGIDQRFIDRHVTHQISLGDFVLSGGEIAAMALLDALARLQPGVLNDEGSHQFDRQAVPEALLSGHHERIARHRREQSLATTARWRPDVIESVRAAGRLSPADEAFLRKLL
jgi:tRNA (guanine37-N1)-methyltransferase